jgi:hypothetical protein
VRRMALSHDDWTEIAQRIAATVNERFCGGDASTGGKTTWVPGANCHWWRVSPSREDDDGWYLSILVKAERRAPSPSSDYAVLVAEMLRDWGFDTEITDANAAFLAIYEPPLRNELRGWTTGSEY